MGITNHYVQLVFQRQGVNHYVNHVMVLGIPDHIQ